MYKEAWDQPTREEKTRYALTHMGATVIGGGLTTGDLTKICLAKKDAVPCGFIVIVVETEKLEHNLCRKLSKVT
jgi:hypothetical protein